MVHKISEDRRRAVRLVKQDLKGVLKCGKKTYPLSDIVDMSSLGIGVQLGTLPKKDKVQILFESPSVLKGLEICCRKKHSRKVQDKPPCYQIGYEFRFRTLAEETQLHQWMIHNLKQQKASACPVARTHSVVDASMPIKTAEWIFRFPQNQEEFEQCFRLITSRVTQHLFMQTKYFIALEERTVIAVVALIPDVLDLKLPAETWAPELLEGFRKKNRKVSEILAPCFQEVFLESKNPTAVYVRRMQILLALFPYLLAYARYFAGIDYLVVRPPVYLEGFFRMWLFDYIDEDKKAGKKFFKSKVSQSRCMGLDLSKFEKVSSEKYLDLYSWVTALKDSDDFLNRFSHYCYPSDQVLARWFQK